MPKKITCEPGSTKNNPTGGWRTYVPKTDKEHCISCGTCARVCPENCVRMIKMPAGPDLPETDYNFCKGCGVCAAECPVKVIAMGLERK